MHFLTVLEYVLLYSMYVVCGTLCVVLTLFFSFSLSLSVSLFMKDGFDPFRNKSSSKNE